ncbi:MAG: DUF4925 domain-containing protein [Bryobacteraceae bacterium]|nr:DUF4925 domain-containing protein [Bryobacteraceae bacterium]
MKKTILWTLMGTVALLRADQDTARGFAVNFNNCTEWVGWGPVRNAVALPLVPNGFQAALVNGSATAVVRAANCASVTVDGRVTGPGTVAHVGINIQSPDNTGLINNYTLSYVTSDERLARELEKAGLPVVVDEKLAYEFTPAANDPNTGTLYVDVTPDRAEAGAPLPYSKFGVVTNPTPGTEFPFLANWWYRGKHGVIKMATDIPLIGFGNANVKVYTRRSSTLGQLFGANEISGFTLLNVRGRFANAVMRVSLR